MQYPDLFKPAMLGLLGLTPMLAVCTTLISGLSIGVIYLVVLMLTSLTVFFSRRFIPPVLKPVYLLLITSAWITLIDLLLQAWLYPVRNHLGIYLFILAMNTALLCHLEEAPSKSRFKEGGLASLKTGLTAVALLTVIGLLREITAKGGILTDISLLSHIDLFGSVQSVYVFNTGLHLFNTTAGAFIIFGLLLSVLGRYRFHLQ